ncbi:MAG: serine kinase [Microthrixaceae bacterium]
MAQRTLRVVTDPPGGRPRPTRLLSDVAGAAEAVARGGVVERSFLIAGLPVRFEFAGPALADMLTRALRHLPECPDETPALTVVAWDTASTGAPGPTLPLDEDPAGPQWRRVLVDDPPLHAVYKPGPGSLSVVDRARSLAWYWCADARDVPVWEQGTPFLHVFHHWLSSRGMQLAHAGAAGDLDGGFLFVGKSGSGKSTSTLACVESGMRYFGDDYVVVAADPSPTVHALYSSGKLDDGHIERFPDLAQWVVNADGPPTEKRVFFLADHAPERTAVSAPLTSVLLPSVTGREATRLVPTSSARALGALAPSTIFQMPGAAGAELSAMAALLRRLPAHVLEAGTDLSTIAPALRALNSHQAP